MAINPLIYSQSEAQIVSDLLPPSRRNPKWLAWLTALMSAVQYCHDLLFNDYQNGSSASAWVSGTTYAYLARVVYVDGSVYELQNTAGLTSTTSPNVDLTNWKKVLDIWIGVRERAHYNGQKIMLEYILNKYFNVSVSLPFTGASHTTQIWISNSNGTNNFWLSNYGAGARTSYLRNTFYRQFMAASNNTSFNNFVIHVPSAVYAAIGANQPSGVTASQAISALANQYVQMNYTYTIVTY